MPDAAGRELLARGLAVGWTAFACYPHSAIWRWERLCGRLARRAVARRRPAEVFPETDFLLDQLALGAVPMLIVPAMRPAFLEPEMIGAFPILALRSAVICPVLRPGNRYHLGQVRA